MGAAEVVLAAHTAGPAGLHEHPGYKASRRKHFQLRVFIGGAVI